MFIAIFFLLLMSRMILIIDFIFIHLVKLTN